MKLDVRDLGGHLDTTISGWSATLVAQVRLVISRLASLLASSSLQMLRSSISRVVWSRRQPLANVGALLVLCILVAVLDVAKVSGLPPC